jgi:glutaminyl-peptide cyclotransferase
MSRKNFTLFFLLSILIALIIFFTPHNLRSRNFNGEKAYKDIVYQVSLGPRIPGSTAHQNIQSWISSELKNAGWAVTKQDGFWNGFPIHNIIANRGSGDHWIILGAHYDTRIVADRDPDITKQNEPVPGANDGGSGVSVLLELARCLPQNSNYKIWLVFFDAEDNGNINGYDWSLGSRFFVSELDSKPDQVIILDMIGDKDLNIYLEKNSDFELTQSIWDQAAILGYQQFIPESKYRIIDDHIPFLEAGIPAIDIIDFDYPYWHTTLDTPDKVSAHSLKVVGDTLITWLKNIDQDF